MKKPLLTITGVVILWLLLLSATTQAQSLFTYDIHAGEGTQVRGLVSHGPQSLYATPITDSVRIDLVTDQIEADILSGTYRPSGLCNSNVPFIVVDFSEQPGGIFNLNDGFRNGFCCGLSGGGNRCFEVLLILSDKTAAVSIKLAGATATGSANWWLTPLPHQGGQCALPSFKVGDQACISKGGMYALTFCKPGQNNYNLVIEAIPHPHIGETYEVRQDCNIQLNAMGFESNGITWSGQHLNALDFSTGLLTPTFAWKPGMPLYPEYIEYSVCGPVLANNACTSHVGQFCATTRVFVYPKLTAGISPESPKFCHEANVLVEASISGGKPPYTLWWTDPQGNVFSQAPTAAIALAGQWNLKVADQLTKNGCGAVEQTFNVEKVSLSLSANISEVKCYGGNTGSITAIVAGGNLPYTYSWSHNPALNEPVANNLAAGNYSLKVTDTNGCSAMATYVVSQPESSLTATAGLIIHESCFGANNGSAELIVKGGMLPYVINVFDANGNEVTANNKTSQYQNNPKQNPEAFSGMVLNTKSAPWPFLVSNLAPGKFTVKVSDANGCVTETTFEIESGNQFEVNITAGGGTTFCRGGSVELTATAGISYLWSTGQTTRTILVSEAGKYTVEVINEDDCKGEAIIEITVNDPPQVSLAPLENVCEHGPAFELAGGWPLGGVYSGPGVIDGVFDPTRVGAGTYQITYTYTDSLGCTGVATASIFVQTMFAFYDITDASCFGASNGGIKLEVHNGNGAYTFIWNNGATTQNLENIPAGTYSVEISDGINCKLFVTNMVVGEPSEITISGELSHPAYLGATDGKIITSVNGGAAPYSYVWSNGNTTSAIHNLAPGTYSVTVTDAKGCQAEADFVIDQGPVAVDLKVTVEVNIATPDPTKINELIFAVVVTNLNPLLDATGVTVENLLPGAFPFIDRLDAGAHGTYDHASGIWNIGTIGAGQYALLVYRTGLLLSQTSPSATNAAQIRPFDQTDPNLINNYDEVVVAMGESSGGNDGGIESEGSMASKIALRHHRRMVEGTKTEPENRMKEMPAFDVTEMLTGELKTVSQDETPATGINFFIPERGPAQTRAYISTPADLLAITNANEIFAVDYLQENNARRAAILAIATDAGTVYEHTKVICDRLTGATLKEIRHIQIAGQPFILSKLVHPNGYTDYSVSFIATWKNNGFTIDNRWHNELYNPGGTSEVFNFQVWSVAPQMTRELVESILKSMALSGPVSFGNATSTPQIPQVYVQSGSYRNGKLILELVNTNGASKISLQGSKATVENGHRQRFQLDVNIPSTPFSTVEVNVGHIFDAGFSIANNLDETRDVLYYADGPWMFDYDPGNSVVTHFSTKPESRLLHDKSYGVERDASLKGTVRTYASLFRRLGPGTQSMDLSKYTHLAFHASGTGTVEVMLAKAGIKTWDKQFRTVISLEPAGKNYTINLSDLKTADGQNGFTAEDLVSVIFNPIGNGSIASAFEINVSGVHFSNHLVEAKATGIFYPNYPNPFNTTTSFEFVVNSQNRVRIEVLNLLGQTLEVLKDNTLAQGAYKVNWTPGNIRPGIYMFRITIGEQTYTGKMVYRP